MKTTLLSGIMLLASLTGFNAVAGDIDVESLKDVAVAQQNEDGSYNVICANGNREHVTAVDVRLGNVCPNDKNSQPTQILSLQRRSDGQFDVVCRDLTKTVASEEQIIAGQVCKGEEQPSVVIEDGVYVASGYSPCTLKAIYEGKTLVGLHASYSNTTTADMTCKGNICTGKFTGYPQVYQFKILSKTSFEYSYDGGRSPMIYNKQ